MSTPTAASSAARPCGLVRYEWWHGHIRGHCRCGWATHWKGSLAEVWLAYDAHRGARLLVRSDVEHGTVACISYREERGE